MKRMDLNVLFIRKAKQLGLSAGTTSKMLHYHNTLTLSKGFLEIKAVVISRYSVFLHHLFTTSKSLLSVNIEQNVRINAMYINFFNFFIFLLGEQSIAIKNFGTTGHEASNAMFRLT